MFLEKPIAYVALGVSLWFAQGTARAEEPSGSMSKPNIIYIMADDLGYGDLGCYGQTDFRTPNIDKLAAGGMRFTQHYAGASVCMPSRVSWLTGKHQGHASIRGNRMNISLPPDPADITVARLLKNAGYVTANIGKTGATFSDDGSKVLEKGFDHFFGHASHGAAHRQYPPKMDLEGGTLPLPGNHGYEGASYGNQLLFDDAVRFIQAHKNEPMFIHIAPTIPHPDLNAPPEYVEKFLGRYDEPKIEKEDPKKNGYRFTQHPKATFVAMMTFLDDQVGRVVDTLRAEGLEGNTLVIFTSDNGAMNEGYWKESYFNSSGPLRGFKRDLYEGGIRVPHIVYWPGKVKPGTTTDLPSAFWDFLPTSAELVGAKPPADIDGISYLPTMLGDSESQRLHEYLYWEFHEQGGKQAVRWGNWKGVRLQVDKDSNGPIELYHLADDLGETKDVAATQPEVVEKIRSLMQSARTENADFAFSGEKRK